ncbi:DUF523 domain-containing protein [Clostridium sp. 'deep sea']|uniref:DUF523 domain-containing protein n=1 Tax=Clostridium sp. 'deep sea' TaxID=2779445 RepID=UPI0018969D01|nr:DUF523 domain-containing protein [Clostridium sp. 'deep sea']QOR36761.1 DUF523 domain-containing protein [Clostridium sp. 'deep sea']
MVIVSACLVGIKCRYNGKCTNIEYLQNLITTGEALPLCPEVLGGLPIPRPCCEIVNHANEKKVINTKNEDITSFFKEGATKTLQIAQIVNAKIAVLQSRSPSCGYLKIYDGSFSGNFVKGNGFTSQMLLENDIKIFTEQQLNEFKEYYNKK